MNEFCRPDDLFKTYLSGNRKALADLFQILKKPLFAYLFRMCLNPELAEDLLQETFISIYSKSRTFDSQRKFMPWAYAIAKNKFLEWKRQEKKIIPLHKNSFREKESKERIEKKVEIQMDVNSLLNDLGEEIKEAFILKHFHGLKFWEISQIQEVPLPTAKSRVFFAIKKLKEGLKK